MKTLWHYQHGGQACGPVAFSDLRRLASRGELQPIDLIRQEGTFHWVPASSQPELFGSPEPEAPEELPDPPGEKNTSARRSNDSDSDEWDDDRRSANGALEDAARLVKRAFSLRLDALEVTAEEARLLRRAGIKEVTGQRYAVWRKSLLWMVLAPTSFAAIFHLINLVSMEKQDRDHLSRFGMALSYLQALALFVLPICAAIGAVNYRQIRLSSKVLLGGAVVAFAVPILSALVPAEYILDTKIAGDEARLGIGIVFGLMFYVTLLPTILSLLPALSRACLRMKSLLPASIAPGWGFLASAPLFMLIGFASFILIYHIFNNFLLLIGVLLWVGAPMAYLTRAELLIHPISRNRDLRRIASTQIFALGAVSLGVVLIVIFLFTAKLGGKYLVGTDKFSSMIRPWDLDIHARWVEFVGRSLFLTVVFMDLLMRMNLSIWKAHNQFSGLEEASDYDRDLKDLENVLAPPAGLPEDEDDDR